MYYIQELDKQTKIDKIFLRIKVKENIIYIPKLKEFKNQKLEKEYLGKRKNILNIVNKVVKVLENDDCNKVVLSKNLKENELFVNYLYTYNIDIYNGKYLLEILSANIIDYIVEKKCLNKEQIQITIAVNDISDIMFENIKLIIEKYKKVNIATKNIIRFKKMEEIILEKLGKIIQISDNKKKSLLKSDIILNIDFDEELLNKYIIKEDAIIMNIKNNVKIYKKRFNGININDYEITCKDDIFKLPIITESYFTKDMYEAILSNKLLYQEINNKLRNDNVELLVLKGNNTNI